LQHEEDLDWVLLIRYTHDKITGAISCSQEAYIDRLLVKYGMENANAGKLPMNPGSGLDLLPVLDMPDKIVMLGSTALMSELLYIAINTVPQLSYSMSCLTWYKSKATPAHLIYRTTLVASLLLTTCTVMVAVSALLCEYALFRNSFMTD